MKSFVFWDILPCSLLKAINRLEAGLLPISFTVVSCLFVSRDSAVGIATGYGLDD
jgi:hypothetical protein